jgi:hypothetical protein
MNKGHDFGLQWFEASTPNTGVPPILSVQAGHCHAAAVKVVLEICAGLG